MSMRDLLSRGTSDAALDAAHERWQRELAYERWQRELSYERWQRELAAEVPPDAPPSEDDIEAMYQAHCAEVARGER